MMCKEQLIEKLKCFIEIQLNNMSNTSPAIGFLRPLIIRMLKNKLSGSTSFLDLIADETGNIDAENILSEMMVSVMNTQQFHINIPTLGDVAIGEGKIEVGIPFTDKSMVFNNRDLTELKELLAQ